MFLVRNKNIEREMSFAGKAIRSSNTVELYIRQNDKL